MTPSRDPLNYFRLKPIRSARVSEISETTAAAPVANAGPARVAEPGFPVVLDGSGSTDDYGIWKYQWDFDLPAFAESFGVTSGGVAMLREEVRKSMEREVAEATRAKLREQLGLPEARLPLLFVPEPMSHGGAMGYAVRGREASIWLSETGIAYRLQEGDDSEAEDAMSWVVALGSMGKLVRRMP